MTRIAKSGEVDPTSVEDVGLLRKWFELLWRNLFQRGLRFGALWTYDLFHRLIVGVSPRRFTEVREGLHVGGQFKRHGLPYMEEQGITAVVNMRIEFDDRQAGIAPEHYLHLPTIDNTPPTLDDLRRGAEFIEGQLSAGGEVYVHCEAGVGRAPSMAAAYLVLCQGVPPQRAWDQIRETRPFIRPTLSQIEQIVELGRVREAAIAMASNGKHRNGG